MRVLGYIRLSRETEATTSPERQREIILNWANIHEHKIVDWVEDLGVSGSVNPWERPNLKPWLTERSDEYDMIVGARVDRISRRLMHFAQLIAWATDNKIAIASATEPIDTSDKFGRMVANMLAMFAEFEREAIQERNHNSYTNAWNNGKWHGGTPPYGYRAIKNPAGKGWVLVKDGAAVAIIEEICRRLLDGDSLNAVATYLNTEGVVTPLDHVRLQKGQTPKGHSWATPSLKKMLQSKTLLGMAERNGKVLYGDQGLPVMRAEPILTRQKWGEVQDRLEKLSDTKPRTRKTSPLLGIAFCLFCGNSTYRVVSSGGRPYYRCRATVDARLNCNSRAIQAERLESIVESTLLKAIGGEEVMQEVRIAGESHSEALEAAKAAWNDLQNESAGKPAAVKTLYAGKIAAVEERIATLSALPETVARTELRGTGKLYAELWRQGDAAGRRKLLLDAGVRIEAAPANGPEVSVGRFERPDRYDEAVLLGIESETQYAFFLPRNLVARATRQSAN